MSYICVFREQFVFSFASGCYSFCLWEADLCVMFPSSVLHANISRYVQNSVTNSHFLFQITAVWFVVSFFLLDDLN